MADVLLVLGLYLMLAVAYFGWGRAGAYLLRLQPSVAFTGFTTIWLGWVLSVFLLQTVHLLLPIDSRVSALLFGAGICFSIPEFRRLYRERAVRKIASIGPFVFLITAIAIWVAGRSMVKQVWGDLGLYYLSTINWINQYPIVPGLGNLHGRLAFNQSYFLYLSSLQFYPYFRNGFRIANGFLFLLLLSEVIWRVNLSFRKPREILHSHSFLHLPYIFILVPLVYLCVTTEGLGTGTADFGSTMLQLEILFIALQIRTFLPTDSKKNQALLLVGLFAITSLTVKLSNFAFSLSTITIAAYCFVFTGPFKSRRVMGAVRFVLPLALIALVWTIRGYLLSGVPAYPSTVFRIPTDWAVPADMIRLEAQWAYSWARAPFQYPDLVLGNWKWFRPWLAAIEGKTVDFVYPMVFSLLVFLLTIAMRAWAYWRKRQFPPGWEFSILIPIAAGWVFWFMTAPNLRFANALIFLLQIGMVLICLSHVQALAPRGMAAAVCALFLAMNLPLVRSLQRNPLLLTSISTTGFQQMGTEQLDRMQTRSGLMLYTPVNTDACWDSPLPCTPYFNPGLKLRGSDLKSGFAVTESNWILLHPVLPSTPH